MARIRTVKPEISFHEKLFDLEQETGYPIRFIWAVFPCHCDREGNFEWRPRPLGSQIVPYDGIDFSRVLHALATRGFIVAYRVGDEWYGRIPTFTKHQVVNNRENASDIPPFDDAEEVWDGESASCTRESRENDACGTRDQSAKAERNGREQGREQGREGKDLSVAPRPSESEDSGADDQALTPTGPEPAKQSTGSESFERWWAAYPKKVKKRNARDVWKRKRLDAQADDLIADVEHRHANDRKWIDGYIPDPERYLKHERWNDEIEPPRDRASQNEQAGDEFLRRIGASNA